MNARIYYYVFKSVDFCPVWISDPCISKTLQLKTQSPCNHPTQSEMNEKEVVFSLLKQEKSKCLWCRKFLAQDSWFPKYFWKFESLKSVWSLHPWTSCRCRRWRCGDDVVGLRCVHHQLRTFSQSTPDVQTLQINVVPDLLSGLDPSQKVFPPTSLLPRDVDGDGPIWRWGWGWARLEMRVHTAPWLSPLWNSVSEDREGDGAGPTPTREGGWG